MQQVYTTECHFLPSSFTAAEWKGLFSFVLLFLFVEHFLWIVLCSSPRSTFTCFSVTLIQIYLLTQEKKMTSHFCFFHGTLFSQLHYSVQPGEFPPNSLESIVAISYLIPWWIQHLLSFYFNMLQIIPILYYLKILCYFRNTWNAYICDYTFIF